MGGGRGWAMTDSALIKNGRRGADQMDVCRCWSALFPLTAQHTQAGWEAPEGPKWWTFVSCLFAVTHRGDDELERQRWIIDSSRDVNVDKSDNYKPKFSGWMHKFIQWLTDHQSLDRKKSLGSSDGEFHRLVQGLKKLKLLCTKFCIIWYLSHKQCRTHKTWRWRRRKIYLPHVKTKI